MAADPFIDFSSHVEMPTNIPEDPKSLARVLWSVVSALVARVNGNISSGTGDHLATRGNLVGRSMDVLTPAVADTDFEIRHDLGYIPQHCIIARADCAASIYDASAISRTEAIIGLRCNVASATLKLEIY